MKKIIFALIILVVWTLPLSAETYNSPFGFSIDIPSNWRIFSKEEVKNNLDLFDVESDDFNNLNKDIAEEAKAIVTSGEFEFYFNRNTSDPSFSIFVFEQAIALPQNPSLLKKVYRGIVAFIKKLNVFKKPARAPRKPFIEQFCKLAPAELSQSFGKHTTVYACKFKKVADSDSIYLVHDGLEDGTINIQYLIPKSPSICITIVATCENENYASVRKEFDEIIASLTFH